MDFIKLLNEASSSNPVTVADTSETGQNSQPGATAVANDCDDSKMKELEELKKLLAAKDAEIAVLKAQNVEKEDPVESVCTTNQGDQTKETKRPPKMDVTLSIRGTPEFDSYPYSLASDKFFYMASIKAPYFREDDRAPIDLVAVVDESGSMSGTRIKLVKETVKFIIKNLEHRDRFGIIGYSTNSRRLLPLTLMDATGKKNAEEAASNLRADGATALCQGLVDAVNMMRERISKNEIASVMILTDGEANQGPTTASEINAAVRAGKVPNSDPWHDWNRYNAYNNGYNPNYLGPINAQPLQPMDPLLYYNANPDSWHGHIPCNSQLLNIVNSHQPDPLWFPNIYNPQTGKLYSPQTQPQGQMGMGQMYSQQQQQQLQMGQMGMGQMGMGQPKGQLFPQQKQPQPQPQGQQQDYLQQFMQSLPPHGQQQQIQGIQNLSLKQNLNSQGMQPQTIQGMAMGQQSQVQQMGMGQQSQIQGMNQQSQIQGMGQQPQIQKQGLGQHASSPLQTQNAKKVQSINEMAVGHPPAAGPAPQLQQTQGQGSSSQISKVTEVMEDDDDSKQEKEEEGGDNAMDEEEGLDELPCTINTFGFGASHNAQLMKAIAENGRGMYAFIENTDQIAETFAECLGGLVSVVGQNLKVQVQALNNVEINRCLAKGYAIKVDIPKKKHTISVKDLQSEESRDFVFELTVPKIDGEKKEDPLIQLSVSYDNMVKGTKETLTNICNIARIDGKQIGERNVELDQQYNRVVAADAMLEAEKLAQSGKLEDARNVLSTAELTIKGSKSNNSAFCMNLVQDMGAIRSNMVDHASFQNQGSQQLAQMQQCQQMQRSFACTQSASLQVYSTASRDQMRTKSQAYHSSK